MNLQRRLYDIWMPRLMSAIEIGEVAGPGDRLDEVLAHIEAAEAAVRTARDAQLLTGR